MKRMGAALVALCLGASMPAAARVLGDAQVAYSAQRALTIDGRAYNGALYATPGHQRHEQTDGGIHEVAILDLGAGRGYFVLPALQSYVEFQFQQAIRELSAADVTSAPQGREMVNGIATTRYRVSHAASDGTRVEGMVWLDNAGIPMRGEGTVTQSGNKRTRFSWELSELRLGPQDPALFAVPAGFYRLPIETLPPFLGGAG